MYLLNVGVSVCSTADTNNPYFYGDGKITSTDEELRWKMWYPCV